MPDSSSINNNSDTIPSENKDTVLETNLELTNSDSSTISTDSVKTFSQPSESEYNTDINSSTELSTIYKDTIIVRFIKENIQQSPDSLYFNILKISNYTKEKVSGELSFSFPDGWNIISAQGNILELLPNDSAFIPVRLAINKESIGALTYILNASFKTEDEVFSTNAYLTIPGFSQWKMSLNKSVVYFNQYNESENIKLKISNKGNTTETIKLEYKIGQLLKTSEIDNFNNTQYVTLESNKDTTINIIVKSNTDLSYNDRILLERNWKEASFEVKASSLGQTEKQSVWFKKLYSEYYGLKIANSSPLNIGVTCDNLLSNIYIRLNSEVFGTILFPKERDLSYRLNIFGLGFQKEAFKYFDFNRQSTFFVKYKEKKFNITIGDNVGSSIGFGGGLGLGLSGRGISFNYSIDETSEASISLIKSKFLKNSYGGVIKYKKKIFNIGLNAGIGYSKRDNPNSSIMSALIGTTFSILKHNHFSLSLIGTSLSYYNSEASTNYSLQDTTIIGYGYKLGYSIAFKKFNIHAVYQSILKSINAGNNFTITSEYKFNKGRKIALYYNRRASLSNDHFYSLYKKSLRNITELGRVVFYYPTSNSVTFGIGPYYNAFIKESIDKNLYVSQISTYNPKIYFTINKRLSNYKSLSGFFTIGTTYIHYKTENPNLPEISLKSKGNYSLGSTYSNKSWRISASYNVGSMTDLWYNLNYQLYYPDAKQISRISESIVIRPTYEKAFYENRILLQLLGNYAYYLPSKRENFSIGLMSQFNLDRGWSASLSANLFFNSVETDNELGRISSKDMNIQVGIRKAFDIQQPRIKQYDLTIICFKDLNGNKIKDENEPPLPNIQVTYERTVPLDNNDEEAKINTNFAVLELITSPDGQVFYGNIPEGVYFVSFKPLTNLKDLYNVNGDQQTVRISSNNTTYFVPFAETYKVKGKVIIERDEFSSEGSLSYEGIRITAIDPNGESYSVLTDKNGEYMLSVPQAQSYKVSVNQVFNDQFICERGDYTVHFNGIKVINLDFKFYEKKRKVNFDSAIDALYIFNSLNTTNSKTKLGKEGFKTDIDTSNVLIYIDQVLETNDKNANLFPVSNVTDEGIIFKLDLYPPTDKRLSKDQITMPAISLFC